MNIKINEDAVNEAVEDRITKVVADSVSSYAVTETISKVIAQEVSAGAIGEAIASAASSLDTQALSNALSQQMQRTMVTAFSHVIESSAVKMILDLQGVKDYASDYDMQAARVLAQLQAKKS